MKKLILFLTLFLFCISSFSYAQISIQEARNLPAGTVVTVKGIATNGSEMGIIRYFQDGTAGIAAYGPLRVDCMFSIGPKADFLVPDLSAG